MPELGSLGNVLRVDLDVLIDTKLIPNLSLLEIKNRFSRIPR